MENFLHLVERQIQNNAIVQNITHETLEKFSAQISKTIYDYLTKEIYKIIKHIPKWMKMIEKNKETRLKY